MRAGTSTVVDQGLGWYLAPWKSGEKVNKTHNLQSSEAEKTEEKNGSVN